jgi:hypothetical protein
MPDKKTNKGKPTNTRNNGRVIGANNAQAHDAAVHNTRGHGRKAVIVADDRNVGSTELLKGNRRSSRLNGPRNDVGSGAAGDNGVGNLAPPAKTIKAHSSKVTGTEHSTERGATNRAGHLAASQRRSSANVVITKPSPNVRTRSPTPVDEDAQQDASSSWEEIEDLRRQLREERGESSYYCLME